LLLEEIKFYQQDSVFEAYRQFRPMMIRSNQLFNFVDQFFRNFFFWIFFEKKIFDEMMNVIQKFEESKQEKIMFTKTHMLGDCIYDICLRKLNCGFELEQKGCKNDNMIFLFKCL
jgi:lantibiotic modifying enzyme